MYKLIIILGMIAALLLPGRVYAAGKTWCSSESQIAAAAKAGFLERKNVIDIPIRIRTNAGSVSRTKKMAAAWIQKANECAIRKYGIGCFLDKTFAYTKKGNEGDYLRFTTNIKSISFLNDIRYGKNEYQGTLRINLFGYDTTVAEESQMENIVDNYLPSICLERYSQYRKILEIYKFICSRVHYDHSVKSEDYIINPKAWTAYNALHKKKAVCQGFALLFYRMCTEAGIRCRILSNTYKVTDEKGNQVEKGHAWNMVTLYGKAYLCDTTWDAENGKKGIFHSFLLDKSALDRDYRGYASLDPASKRVYNSYQSNGSLALTQYVVPLEVSKGSGSGMYRYGEVATVKANRKYIFMEWEGNAAFTSGTDKHMRDVKVFMVKDTWMGVSIHPEKPLSGNVRILFRSGEYMCVHNDSKKNGAAVVAGTKRSNSGQFRFEEVKANETVSAYGSLYIIKNVYTGKYLTIGSKNEIITGDKQHAARFYLLKDGNSVNARILEEKSCIYQGQKENLFVTAERGKFVLRPYKKKCDGQIYRCLQK